MYYCFLYDISVLCIVFFFFFVCVFFVQAEDGIRDLVRSRGLGDVYKRQDRGRAGAPGRGSRLPGRAPVADRRQLHPLPARIGHRRRGLAGPCLLYTSDAADERSSVDLGGRRIIKKKSTV